MPKTISVIVPVFNEGANLRRLYNELLDLKKGEPAYHWEILFLDNHSTDDSFARIEELTAEDSQVQRHRDSSAHPARNVRDPRRHWSTPARVMDAWAAERPL